MSLSRNLRFIVKTAMRDSGITHAEISRRSGVSEKHLSGIKTGKANVNPGTAEKILTATGYRLRMWLEKT